MIPTLYDPLESQGVPRTDFSTLGIGALTDATSCLVRETLDGEYELTMEYPQNGSHAGELLISYFVKAKPNPTSAPQVFQIYRSQETPAKISVYARHLSSQLSYYVVSPTQTVGTAADALSAMKSNIIPLRFVPFVFSVDADVGQSTQIYNQKTPASFRSRMKGVEGSIVDLWGGEWEFDNYDVFLRKKRGRETDVSLRWGRDLSDMSRQINWEKVYTSIIGYWHDTEGNNNVWGDLVYADPSAWVGETRTLAVDFSEDFDARPTAERLTQRAEAYIAANKLAEPQVTIKLEAVPNREVGELSLGDRVKIVGGIIYAATARVTDCTYDVLRERYTRLTIGNAQKTILNRIGGAL